MTTTEPKTQVMSVRWLIDPDPSDATSSFPATTDIDKGTMPFPPEIGCGELERLPLSPGISIIRGVHRFHKAAAGKLVSLGEFSLDFGETTLCVQTIHGGAACHREFHPRDELIFKPGFDFFRHANRFHTIPMLDSSTDSEMTALNIADTALNELIGKPLAQELIIRLGLDTPPAVKVLPLPLHISASLRACVSSTLTGPLKKLFAQSKTLEYLCHLTAYVCTPTSSPQVVGRKRALIREIHDRLVEMEGKLPSLDGLAKEYGMSARWLNDEFAREYGQPIYSFVAERRLCESHTALSTSLVPIKLLSQRMGYSHVNHFSTAFKKKFGYPPSALRKNGAAKDE